MSNKQDIINDVSRFQRVCSAFVQRNVIYCASTLIYELREVAEKLDDYDTYMTLTGGRPDYEEAARYFIMQGADLGQLEEIADEVSSWAEITEAAGVQPDADVDEWLEDNPDGLHAIRSYTWGAVTDPEHFEWVCSEYSLDPDYSEVYEHWIVDRYFGARLHERGEIVEEYLGLLLWGRTCTGQAISMDYVIEEMVKDLDDDHWVWGEA